MANETFEILTSVEDFTLVKLQLLTALIGATLRVEKKSEADLLALDPSAKGLLLRANNSYLSQHIAILRYIAETFNNASLLGGEDEMSRAQINQWLEFSWEELEVPLQASTISSDVAVRAKVKQDTHNSLSVLEDHLSSRTYIVGETISLGDVSIFVAFLELLNTGLLEAQSFRALNRWARTIAAQPRFSSILGEKVKVLYQSLKNLVGSSSSATSGKWDRHRTRVKELLKEGDAAIGKEVVVKGWVRTIRTAEKGLVLFVELTDGSTVRAIQLVLNSSTTKGAKEVGDSGGAGACLAIVGTVVASPAKGQTIEIHVTDAKVLGAVYGGDNGEIGGKNYPMAKKQHTLEFLREKAHMRPRSKVFSSALRVRHAMAYATHKFFNDRGFVYVHTPLITAADCEGAGEQFAVSTLLPEHAKLKDIPVDKAGNVDFSKDFFGRRCCLTVSGQLNVETVACALSDVYTFGPTFRAENSHTARHLAEFWMIEPEICFADLVDDMGLAEDYVKFCTSYALEHCADDLHYFEHEYPQGEKGLQDRLRNVVENDFAKITYTEAVSLLQEAVKKGEAQFLVYPQWGDDLGSEHERYITEKVYKKPTIVINYPKGIKAFYMKVNDDKETVAAMDVLVPKIGELIGGSQREDNLTVLEQRCKESGLDPKDIWWYADLRRYGTVPHAGFGLGFERLIMFVTGLENIRDVIPFPRVPGHAEF